MRVRPVFLVLLALVVVAAVLTLTLGRRSESRADRINAAIAAQVKAWQAYLGKGRPYVPETLSSIDRLKRDRGLVPVRRCQFVRCYVMAQPTRVAALQLPALIASIGASTKSLPTQLKGLNWCRLNARVPREAVCTYQAILDHNLISVSLGPYFPCDPAPCRLTHESDLTFDIPVMTPTPTP
jgi:hypothetical protein